MNSRRKSTLIGGALALVLSTVSSQAATITNGGFETGTNAPTGINFRTLTAGSGNSGDIAGWTVTSGSVDWINQYWTPSEGQRSLDMSGNGAGSIAQTITGLDVGQKYRISFDMAGNNDGGDVIKTLIAAVIAGQAFNFDVTGTNNTNMGWVAQSLIFTATAASHLLSFASSENNAYGAALDNVSISAVPVPAALPLFATALAGAGLLGWRRRKNA